MTNAISPAALAEIRERDATCTRCGMPGDGAYPIIPVTGEHADWHICALALYHASIAKDATISRLTAENADLRLNPREHIDAEEPSLPHWYVTVKCAQCGDSRELLQRRGCRSRQSCGRVAVDIDDRSNTK